MNRLQFLLGIILLPLGSGSVFKGTPFSGDIWPKLLSEIPEIPVDSKILCGSICQQNDTCDIFVYINGTCYMGTSNVPGSIGLLGPQSGSQVVFFDLESLERGIESSFIKMNNVSDQGSWEKYVTMEFNNVSSEFSNELDCYNLCQRGGFPCELFVFQNGTCFFGTSDQNSGAIDGSFNFSNVYVMTEALGNLTVTVEMFLLTDTTELLHASWHDFVHDVKNQMEPETCKGICQFQGCPFFVHDNGQSKCYITTMDQQSNPMTSDDFNLFVNGSIGVNPTRFDFDGSLLLMNFVQRDTNTTLSGGFIYRKLAGIDSLKICQYYCYFQANKECEFFAHKGSNCYLGSLASGTLANQSLAIPEDLKLTAYIYKDALKEPKDDLFVKVTLLFKDWSKHKAEEFNVTSELECAAHAILFKNSGSFYKMDGDNGCIIGTFNSKDNVNSTDVTEDDIHVNIVGMQTFIKENFKWKYHIQDEDVLSQHVYKAQDLQDQDQDQTVCNVLCELYQEQECHFTVLVNDITCYLGNFNGNWDIVKEQITDIVQVKQGVTWNNFLKIHFLTTWAKTGEYEGLVYEKSTPSLIKYQCAEICHHDETKCDFAFKTGTSCYLGSFNTTGSVGSYLNGIPKKNNHLFIKRIDDGDAVKNNYFEVRNGNVRADIGFVSSDYWNQFFYTGTTVNADTCAAMCLLNSGLKTCHFYYFVNNKCYLANFNTSVSTLNKKGLTTATSGIQPGTEYFIKPDIDFKSIIEANVERCGNCNNCKNAGLVELNGRVSKIPFKSGNFPENYGDNETCYWYIYALGASQIRITIAVAEVADVNDGLAVFVGLSEKSPIFDPENPGAILDDPGTPRNFTVGSYDVGTKFLVVRWRSDESGTAKGISGFLEML